MTMTAALVIGVYALYAVFDVLPVLRTKKPNLIWPCLALFTAAAVAQVLYELKFNVPSPAPAITQFISGWFNTQ